MQAHVFATLPSFQTKYGTYIIYQDREGQYFAINPITAHVTYRNPDLGVVLSYLVSDKNWGVGNPSGTVKLPE